jgi:hypothetical protein
MPGLLRGPANAPNNRAPTRRYARQPPLGASKRWRSEMVILRVGAHGRRDLRCSICRALGSPAAVEDSIGTGDLDASGGANGSAPGTSVYKNRQVRVGYGRMRTLSGLVVPETPPPARSPEADEMMVRARCQHGVVVVSLPVSGLPRVPPPPSPAQAPGAAPRKELRHRQARERRGLRLNGVHAEGITTAGNSSSLTTSRGRSARHEADQGETDVFTHRC